MLTSQNGHVDMVDMLLQHQATVDLQNKVVLTGPYKLYNNYNDLVTFIMCQNGWSSLMLGSESGHVEVVDKLLQHGARVNLQSKVCRSFASECM